MSGGVGNQAAVYANGNLQVLAPFHGDDRAYANDINDYGEIVGFSTKTVTSKVPRTHALIFRVGRPPILLANPKKDWYASANAVDDRGEIVGVATPTHPDTSCSAAAIFFQWRQPAVIPGTAGAVTVESNGTVLLAMNTGVVYRGCAGPSGATILHGSKRTALPDPASTWYSDEGGGFYPSGMNRAGEVVGSYSYCRIKGTKCQTDGFSCRGMHTRKCGIAGFHYVEGKMISIYSPNVDDACLTVEAINDRGEMVGSTCSRAVRIDGTTVVDLNTVSGAQSSWIFTNARSVNDSGTIVGTGTFNGVAHGYMLVPIR